MPAPAYTLDTLTGGAAPPPYAGNPAAQLARRAGLRFAAVAPPGPWTSDRYAQVAHYTGLVYCAVRAKRDALVAATVTCTKLRQSVRKAVSAPRPHDRDEDRAPLGPGHPLAALFADPNPQDTVGDLLGELVVQQDLHAAAHLWHPLNAAGRPAQLWVLPASAVTYLPPGGLWPHGGYQFHFAGAFAPLGLYGSGGAVQLDAREVLQVRDRHPRVPYGTWGPLDAGAEWVDLARGIDVSQKKSFDNGFTPDVAVSVKGAVQSVIDDTQAQIEARYQGRDGRRVFVYEGDGLDVEKLNTSPREMDYASSKDQATRQVLALFGVNSTVAGLTDADSYASLYAKLRQFYGGTVAQLLQRWSQTLTKHLARRFYGPRYAVEIQVPQPDDPDRLDKQREAAVSGGYLTVNEARGQLDLDPWPDGDVPAFEFQAKRQQAIQPADVGPKPRSVYEQWLQRKLAGEAVGDAPAAGPADPTAGGGVGRGGAGPAVPPAEDAPRPGNPAGAGSLPKRKAVAPPVEYSDPAPYGYCPECRTPGVAAERRPNGNAECGNGHTYPRAKAKYASTQVELTGPAADRLLAMAASIPDADLGDDGREDRPHITVRYGLHAGSPVPVAAVVAGVGPVAVRLGGLAAFRGAGSGRDYDVIYAAVDSPGLVELNRRLAALPHTDTHPGYTPHATVAYVKAGLADKYLAALGRVDADATADRLTFSTAARQETEIPLAAATRKAMSTYAELTGGALVRPVGLPGRRAKRKRAAKRYAARVLKALGADPSPAGAAE